MSTVVYKKAHTTRIEGLAQEEVNGALQDMDLSDKTIEVKLVKGSATPITLAIGSGVTLGGSEGQFFYDVTDANLTSLGANVNDLVVTTINIWTATNQLKATGTGSIRVDH